MVTQKSTFLTVRFIESHCNAPIDRARQNWTVDSLTADCRLLLLLLLVMACAPWHHNVRLASATDLPRNVERVDRHCSVVPKISKRACRVPGAVKPVFNSMRCFFAFRTVRVDWWIHHMLICSEMTTAAARSAKYVYISKACMQAARQQP